MKGDDTMDDLNTVLGCHWLEATRGEPAAEYDCRGIRELPSSFHNVCDAIQVKYQSGGFARNLRLHCPSPNQFNRSRLLELLAGRTVAILGDSMANNLWCGMFCALSLAAPGMSYRTNAKGSSASAISMWPPWAGARPIQWIPPGCADSRRHCGDNPKSALSLHLGMQSVHSLAIKLLHARTAPEPLVLLLFSCASRQHGELWYLAEAMAHAVGWAGLASHADPLRRLCEWTNDGCNHSSFNKASHNMSRRARSRSTDNSVLGTWKKVNGMLKLNTSEGRDIVLLVESSAEHFPELKRYLTGYEHVLDEAGSYDRYGLSAFVAGAKLLHENDPDVLDALQSIRFPWVGAWPSGDRNFRTWMWNEHLPIPFGLGLASESCQGTSQPKQCMLDLLHKAGHNQSSGGSAWSLLPRVCAPTEESGANAPLSHLAPSWRVRMERDLAALHGIPRINSFELRRPRWDLHTGALPGRKLDCFHTSFTPGAYDVELATLQYQLELRQAGRP